MFLLLFVLLLLFLSVKCVYICVDDCGFYEQKGEEETNDLFFLYIYNQSEMKSSKQSRQNAHKCRNAMWRGSGNFVVVPLI